MGVEASHHRQNELGLRAVQFPHEQRHQLPATVYEHAEWEGRRGHTQLKSQIQRILFTHQYGIANLKFLDSVPYDAEAQSDVTKLKLLLAGVDADKIKESDSLKAALIEGFTEAKQNIALCNSFVVNHN